MSYQVTYQSFSQSAGHSVFEKVLRVEEIVSEVAGLLLNVEPGLDLGGGPVGEGERVHAESWLKFSSVFETLIIT
jgi:hypothetical protein